MAEVENGFLKTVSFGGFDKKDVLTYVDRLNTQIYTLQNELEEKKKLLEASGGNTAESEKYKKLLDEDRAKMTELQTSNESLKNQLKTCEEESAAKDAEISDLKKKLTDMEAELVDAKNKAAAASTTENNALDLSNVFIQAQQTANTIVTTAKENARKMDEDAKKLANQVVDDANSKASTIVKAADEKASKILTDAEGKSAEMRTAADNMKAVVLAEISEIEVNVTKLKEVLGSLAKDSLEKVTETADLISKAEDTLKKDGIPQFTMPKSMAAKAPAAAARPAPQAASPMQRTATPIQSAAQRAAAAPTGAAPAGAASAAANANPANAAPKPAAPTPSTAASRAAAPRPAPKANANFGFDLGEIEKMAKAIEADASKHKGGAADDYDPPDPSKIRLGRMG